MSVAPVSDCQTIPMPETLMNLPAVSPVAVAGSPPLLGNQTSLVSIEDGSKLAAVERATTAEAAAEEALLPALVAEVAALDAEPEAEVAEPDAAVALFAALVACVVAVFA